MPDAALERRLKLATTAAEKWRSIKTRKRAAATIRCGRFWLWRVRIKRIVAWATAQRAAEYQRCECGTWDCKRCYKLCECGRYTNIRRACPCGKCRCGKKYNPAKTGECYTCLRARSRPVGTCKCGAMLHTKAFTACVNCTGK